MNPMLTQHRDLFSQAELCADVGELRSILEETHPDPYLNGGGVVAFRKRFADVEAVVPSGGMSKRAFIRLIRPLVAQVKDGHTQVLPLCEGENVRIWVDLGIVEERLVVASVYGLEQEPLLGAVVTSVEGVPFADLCERMAVSYGHDNVYWNFANLARTLSIAPRLADLLDRDSVGPTVCFEVELLDGAKRLLAAHVGKSAPGPRIEPPTAIAMPELDAGDMASGFLDSKHEVAFFRIDSSLKYREAFEVWKSLGVREFFGDHLDEIVRAVTGRAAEGTIDARIAEVPSVIARLTNLFVEMKASKTRTLLVDVRENRGGSDVYATILAYFLYSLDTITAANRNLGYQVPRYSALHFKYREAESIDEVRARISSSFQIGDYDFTQERRWRARGGKPTSPDTFGPIFKSYMPVAQLSPTFAKLISERRWNATWTPRVIVVTSATTFSAGFDAVLRLRSLGASVVGVPPGQAANCFIAALPFELGNTRIRGQVSSKYSVMFPTDAKNGTLLQPDRELTYNLYAAMNFDPNASLRLAMEWAAMS